MNMKFMDTPHYEEVDVAAKTVDSTTGTDSRRPIGRCLITEAAGFAAKHEVVGGDGTPIVTVKRIAEDAEVKEVELFVELAGGVKSLASFKAYAGWYAANRENPDVSDLFTANGEIAEKIVACAGRMCQLHPESADVWKIVDGAGKRWFLRTVATNLTACGKIAD